VYISSQEFFTENRITRFLETELPPGTYLITAKATMTSPAYGGCNIVAGPEPQQAYLNGSFYDNNTVQLLQLMIAKATFTTATSVAIRCGNGFAVQWSVTQPVLTAIPVAAD
jgi:hypothetical protein